MWGIIFFAMIILAVVINVVAIYLYRQGWLRAEGDKSRQLAGRIFGGLVVLALIAATTLAPLLYISSSVAIIGSHMGYEDPCMYQPGIACNPHRTSPLDAIDEGTRILATFDLMRRSLTGNDQCHVASGAACALARQASYLAIPQSGLTRSWPYIVVMGLISCVLAGVWIRLKAKSDPEEGITDQA